MPPWERYQASAQSAPPRRGPWDRYRRDSGQAVPATAEPEAIRLGRLYEATNGRLGEPYDGVLPEAPGYDAGEIYSDMRRTATREGIEDNPIMGRIGAARTGFTQGALAEFADEAAGVIDGPQAREDYRIMSEENWRERPLSYGAGYAAGIYAGAPARVYRAGSELAAQTAARAPRLVRNIFAGASGGAAAGALDATGRAEGDPLERADDAAIGGTFGAAFGGALPVAGTVVAPFARAGRNALERVPGVRRLLPPSQARQDRATAALAGELEDAQLMGGGQATGLNRAAREINQRAGVTTSSGAGSIGRSEVTASRAADRAANTVPRTRATIANVAERTDSDNVIQFLTGVASGRGPARNVVQSALRDIADPKRVAQRIWDRVARTTGPVPTRQRALGIIQRIQRQDARPLYDRLDTLPVRVAGTQLEVIQQTPAIQRALATARRGAANIVDDNAERRALQFIQRVQDGGYRVAEGAPARTWDLVKRALDDTLWQSTQRAVRSGGGMKPTEQARVQDLWRRLVREVDTQTNGAYAAARRAWGGHQATQRAVEHGSRIVSVGREGHTSWIEAARRWSDAERVAAEAGAFQALIDQATKSGTSFANKLGRDLGLEQRILAVFGRQRGQQLIEGLADEQAAVRAIQQISSRIGSQTQPRAQAAQAADSAVAEAGMDIITGQSPLALARGFMRFLFNENIGISPAEAERIMRLALQDLTKGGVSNQLRAAQARNASAALRPPQGPIETLAPIYGDEVFTPRPGDRRR